MFKKFEWEENIKVGTSGIVVRGLQHIFIVLKCLLFHYVNEKLIFFGQKTFIDETS